jgi:hypothetical protein
MGVLSFGVFGVRCVIELKKESGPRLVFGVVVAIVGVVLKAPGIASEPLSPFVWWSTVEGASRLGYLCFSNGPAHMERQESDNRTLATVGQLERFTYLSTVRGHPRLSPGRHHDGVESASQAGRYGGRKIEGNEVTEVKRNE